MPSIFISYRRSDSIDVAGRIYDRLVAHFGKATIFKDVDDIPPGVDFRDYLNTTLNQCQVLLAVMGPSWLNAVDAQGRRRLDNPADWVRVEIEEALRRKDVLVVPLLVSQASLPRPEELPESLRSLAYRNSREARPDPDFHRDMTRLIAGLEHYLHHSQASSGSAQGVRPLPGGLSLSGPQVLTRKQVLQWAGLGGLGLLGAAGLGQLLRASDSELKDTPGWGGSNDASSSQSEEAGGSPGWGTDERRPAEVSAELEELLQAQDWRAADEATLALMLAIADRRAEGWLHHESIENFSCGDLERIDQQWLQASDGRFGFSVQREIYLEACSGNPNSNDVEAWECLGDKVGWYKNGRWLDYEQLSFDSAAPAGHLPARGGWWAGPSASTGWGGTVATVLCYFRSF